MKIKNIILLLSLILVTHTAVAQVSFEAKASKAELGINERLRIDFEMNQDGDNFKPPNFSNFTVVGGPNQSVSNSWINGKRTYKKTYSYFLAPRKRGKFSIGQAAITIQGQTYKTIPVPITVTAAINKPQNPNSPDYIASEQIKVVAEISKTSPYLNEAITVIYKLYVSPTINLRDINVLDQPKFNDFWNQEIKLKELKLQRGTYNNEPYNYVIYKKVVLYPQKIGKLEIEPLSLDIAAAVPTNRRDIFGSRVMRRVNKTVSSATRTIQVKPLPEAGKPVDFTGAVGSFSLQVSTSKTELDATESLQAKVDIKGKGNLKLFKLPKITLPSALEVYEPEHNERVTTTLQGMQGSMSDTYTIVPQYKGKYPIPSISFSYFDLKTKTYKHLHSKKIMINVLAGPLEQARQGTTASGTTKQPVLQGRQQFKYIKTATHLMPMVSGHFFKTRRFWVWLLVPFILIPMAIIFRRKKARRAADTYGHRIRETDRLARKYLSKSQKALHDKETFYIALEKALHNYLKAKLHIETSELTKDRIQILLVQKGVTASVVDQFVMILKNCELARYTPIETATMKDDYNKAAKTISLIDKQAH